MSVARPVRTLPDWLPAWDDPAWWDRYWSDVRPRMVLVRIRAHRRIDIRWGVPLWAIEESLRFALLALPWIAYVGRRVPGAWRERFSRTRIGAGPDLPWPALVALLEGSGEGMLRLEPGEPFVSVRAGDGARHVHVEITQV